MRNLGHLKLAILKQIWGIESEIYRKQEKYARKLKSIKKSRTGKSIL